MDIVHVYWWRPSSLPTCRINASFFQTLSDTPWKNVLPALWAPFNTAKMTHKINDHTCVQKLENLKITVQWRKKFRLSFPPRCVCLPINGIEKRKSCSLCLTLWDPMDCSLPGSSVQGILQARILKWVAISFSRESSQPRNQTRVSCIARGFLPIELRGKPLHGGGGFELRLGK